MVLKTERLREKKLMFIYRDWYLPLYHNSRKHILLNDRVYKKVFIDEWSDYKNYLEQNSKKDTEKVREDWFSYNKL